MTKLPYYKVQRLSCPSSTSVAKGRGSVLVYLGPDNASWEQMKKKYRYCLSSSLSTFKPLTYVFVCRWITSPAPAFAPGFR